MNVDEVKMANEKKCEGLKEEFEIITTQEKQKIKILILKLGICCVYF